MRIYALTATYELRVSRKSHLRDHPSSRKQKVIDVILIPKCKDMNHKEFWSKWEKSKWSLDSVTYK